MLLTRLFRKSAPASAAGIVPREHRACDELGAITRPFSPLIAELLALYCHTRPIGALSQAENCRDEYQMTARQIVHHLLEGWQNQTGGRGTIDDLLILPRVPHLAGAAEARAAARSGTGEHSYAD
ncbi:hypothetical protein [Streptomyces sp. NPDC127084]|uniref:hypothetical protein n=1 Tax=Streptomyces sp. NPDC127084 TaxID=3347133 RepID=UPI0036544519